MSATTTHLATCPVDGVCEACSGGRVVAVIGLLCGDLAGLCRGCLDAAVALGLVQLTGQPAPAGGAR